MTNYEIGFLNKCAEHGLDTGTALGLMEKQALDFRVAKGVADRILSGKLNADRLKKILSRQVDHLYNSNRVFSGTHAVGSEWPDPKRFYARMKNLAKVPDDLLSKAKKLSGNNRYGMYDTLNGATQKQVERLRLLTDLLESGPLRHAEAVSGAKSVGDALSRISSNAPAKFGKGELEVAKRLRDALSRGSLNPLG